MFLNQSVGNLKKHYNQRLSKNIVVGATCPNQAYRPVYFQAITISSFKGQASYRLIQ